MSKWSGNKDRGQREFTAREYEKAVREMRVYHTGKDNGAPMEDIAIASGLPNRTLRAVLSAADGVEFVLGDDGEGNYFVAQYADETEHHTRKLLAQARSYRERAERRATMAQALPRIQGALL